MLTVSHLVTLFRTESGSIRAVDDVSISIMSKATIGLVGESGCGKSATGLSIMRLIPEKSGRIDQGRIDLDGRDLLSLDERGMRGVRGKEIAMIFQEPMTSLNPVYSVGAQIMEAVRLHERVSRKEARNRAIELLKRVGIPGAETRVDDYPHELSGGMRQRVMIAIALACSPRVLIADEPTTALDVTVQAQILDLLHELRDEFGMGVLLITHDLGIVAEYTDEVYVMYAGKIVEHAKTDVLFGTPKHPYTRGLLGSIDREAKRLPTIRGVVADLAHLPQGCRFQDRCSDRIEICSLVEPELTAFTDQSESACHVAEERFNVKGLPA